MGRQPQGSLLSFWLVKLLKGGLGGIYQPVVSGSVSAVGFFFCPQSTLLPYVFFLAFEGLMLKD